MKADGRLCRHGKELHHLAVVEPAKESDLRIKDVVVGKCVCVAHACVRTCLCVLACASHHGFSVRRYVPDLLPFCSLPGWYGDLGTRFTGVVAETPVKENGHRYCSHSTSSASL